jgi:hypothetical protein
MTFARMRDAAVWQKKGIMVKLSRWFSWFDRAKEIMDGGWSSFLLPMMVVGCQEGWLAKDLATWRRAPAASAASAGGAEASASGSGAARASALGVPTAAATGREERAVSQSNREVEKLRHQCHNTLHAAAKVMSSSLVKALVHVIHHAVGPVRKHFGQMLVRTQTRAGVREWLAGLATGSWQDEVLDCYTVFAEHACLVGMGLTKDSQSPNVDQELIANFAFKLVWNLARSRYVTLSAYQFTPTMAFFGLLHDSGEKRACQLRVLKHWWDLLQKLETLAVEDQYFDALLESLHWPKLTWCRMILVKLAEYDFVEIPECVRERLQFAAESIQMTVASENLFRVLREASDHTSNGKQSREMRWFRAVQSPILQDRDMQVPEVRMKETRRQQVPYSVYDPEHKSCSLPKDQLAELLDSEQYPSTTAHSIAHLGWQSFEYHYGDYETIKDSWLSTLARPGVILSNAAGGGLVLESTTRGLVWWRVGRKRFGAFKPMVLAPRTDANPAFAFKSITDFGDWRVAEPKVILPTDYVRRAAAEGFQVAPELAFEAAGPGDHLAKFKARRGFVGLEVPLLQRLHAKLEVPGACPTARPALVRSLVEFVLDDLNEEQIKEILEAAAKDKQAVGSYDPMSVLLSADVDAEGVVDAGMDAQEAEDAKSYIKATRSAREKAAPKAQPAAASAAPAAASSGGAPQAAAEAPPAGGRRWRPPEGRKLEVQDFEGFAPVGCTWTCEQSHDARWRVTYRGSQGKKQTSRRFGGRLGEAEAVRALLLCAWEWHTAESGALCPHVFSP